MRSRKIAVLGSGPAGLAASLVLARDGHDVALIERDRVAGGAPEDAFGWERKGISHFLQPHAFIPRGRLELARHFADVYATLVRGGARDVDVSRKLPGSREPGDDDLQYIAVRRPMIEWALRKAVLEQPRIEILSGAIVRGVRLEGATVIGVDMDGGAMTVDVVVDAMGRRSPARDSLARQGRAMPAARRSECGVIYYSRYFATRPGKMLPDGPWLLGPRGDLGYMGFSTFPGDNGTFAAVLSVPTGVPELKVLMHEAAFDAAVASIPPLAAWANPDTAVPLTPVLPMGGLQNTLNDLGDPSPIGLFPIADALCHTDPVLAHGLSFALIHALEVGRVLRMHEDPRDALEAYRAAVMPALVERYELATALDQQRHLMWIGGAVDFSRRDAQYELFSLVAAGAVAMVDAQVFRVFVRRMGLLDSVRVLDDDERLKERVEVRFRELMARPRAASGPVRDEMLALIHSAMGPEGAKPSG